MRKRHWYAATANTIFVFDTKADRSKFCKAYPEARPLPAVQIVKHIQLDVVVTIKGE